MHARLGSDSIWLFDWLCASSCAKAVALAVCRPWGFSESVIEDGTAPALFEAAFEYQGLFARADVSERLPGGGWRLVEVKSTTQLKDVFVLDVAFQLWVLRGSGLDVRDAGVLTLDRTYVYDGERLDLGALFKLHGVFEQAEAMIDRVSGRAREMQRLIAKAVPPDIAPGDHCFAPYSCPYYAHCARDQLGPEHGIDELPGLEAKRRDALKARGIEEIRDIPADFPLSWLQRIVRRAVREKRAKVAPPYPYIPSTQQMRLLPAFKVVPLISFK